jgi:hypothetical protein
MTRGMALFAAAALALLLLIPQAHAVALGVNRASLSFEDVLRGGYAEAVITVTTDSPEPLGGGVIVEGEAASWLSFSATEFNFSSDHPYELHVIVQPPSDAQIQAYPVNLSIITSPIARSSGAKIGTSTRASFRVPVTIRMTGMEHIACTVGGVQVMDTERGQPVELRVSVLNRGNVRINPDITVDIYDQTGGKKIGSKSVAFGGRIMPTVTNQSSQTMTFDLPAGQYWAAVKVPMCEYAGTLGFDVLEPGELKDDGDFLRIDAQSWARTGEIIPIKAVFRNKGQRGVRAIFKGTITKVDTQEIVKVINTEEYVVGPDATAEMTTYFNPLVGGQYEVAGKVYYNNKLTMARTTIINVNGAPVQNESSTKYIVIIVIVIVILVMLIMIKRKRQQRF